MFDTAHFGNTGLEAFCEAGTSLTVAHKVGGDNMSLLEANRQVCEILGEKGITQNYSVSAFRSSQLEFNTTSELIKAGKSQNKGTILHILSEIADFHTELLESILCSCDEKIRKQLIDYARHLFDEYNSQVQSSDFSSCQEASDYMLGVGEKAYSLLSVGEVIAAKVFVKYLKLHGIPAVYVDTTKLRNITPSEVSARVQDFLVGEFERIYTGNSEAIPIIPGYIGGIQGGILPRLGRGYTDFTGERAAVSMHESGQYDKVLLYIQKMYGFKSTDPRELEDPSHAKSVNTLSYHLAKRAISKRGANAGLINSNALSHDIVQREIGMLVGNPTNNSDVAFISERGNSESEGVELVLGRDYNSEYDDRTYNRVNRCSENHHIVYLMGENMQNMGEIYARASGALKSAGITDIAGESSLAEPREFSFVFKSKEDAQKVQRVLHKKFVEKK